MVKGFLFVLNLDNIAMDNNYYFQIETERLILRDMRSTDDVGMFELDSDAEVLKYLGREPVKSIDESRAIIDLVRQQYIDNGIGRWVMTDKSTNEFIGWAGLKFETAHINNMSGFYDLGYRLIKRYWGKGYATEASCASVQYAKNVLKLKELYGMAHFDNHASRNILTKVGMQFVNEFDYKGERHCNYKIVFGE